jgi:hypothetical protein
MGISMENNKKPIYVWPGNSRMFDGTQPLIYVGPAIFLGAFGFLFSMCLAFLVLWFIPILSVPSNGLSVWFHMKGMLSLFAGKLLPMFQGETYRLYSSQWRWLAEHGELAGLGIRYLLCLAAGVYGSYRLALKGLVPVHMERQIRGRRLLEGSEAYDHLKSEFNEQWKISSRKNVPNTNKDFKKTEMNLAIEAMKADIRVSEPIVLLSDVGLNPNDRKTFKTNPLAEKVAVPDAQRRGHWLVFGGTGRGKTQFVLGQIMQIVYWIMKGKNFKLLLVDTPKADYSRFIPKRLMDILAVDEASGLAHDIGSDLLLPEDVERYWAGKIPLSGKDDIWPNAGRAIGSGICVFFSKIGGTDWSYSNVVWGLNQEASVIEPMLQRVYPEASKILQSGETTLGSVMFTLAANTKDLFKLARIWDGYDYKHDILQFNAKLMKREKALSWWLNTLYSTTFTNDEGVHQVDFNKHIHHMFIGLTKHLNATKPEWTWTDMKELQSQAHYEQLKIADKYSKSTVEYSPEFLPFYAAAILPIAQWAKVWDEYEAKKRCSVRKWVLDEKPEKKILVLSPSARFSEMSDGLIRGLLQFMTGLIDNKYMLDDGCPECPQRNFYIVCDEFQSRGNMREFLMPILERGRSKGISLLLACQDVAQLKKIYGQEDLDFLQSNTGNIIFLGVNAGTTADAISNLVGKKWIIKLHTSQTNQENGKSTSLNYQEHEGMVITPDECSSKVGVKIYKDGTGEIRYLYMPGLLADAYLLKTPLVKYKKQYFYEEPDWMHGIEKSGEAITIENARAWLLTAGGGRGKRIDTYIDPDEIAEKDVIHDAASDMEPYDISTEELDGMEEALLRTERQHLYNLPSEEEGMQGTVMKDAAMSLIGGDIAQSVSHVAEIFTEAKRNVTTSKAKYYEAWKKKKEGLDEFTQN